jgi:hypothetical protein
VAEHLEIQAPLALTTSQWYVKHSFLRKAGHTGSEVWETARDRHPALGLD